MKILAIIPARYASTRFPGKPLADVNGKPMIQRVYEQALKCRSLSEVVVATDDYRIEETVKKFRGKVVMTSDKHESGTDRCYEALKKQESNFDVVINIQGDEPFIQPEQIDKVAACFKNAEVQIATLAIKTTKNENFNNPNVVKLVLNKNNQALYFSRSAIPFCKGSEQPPLPTYYKHVGIYGFRSNILTEITNLSRSPLEIAESLEQLRWLENGYVITVGFTEMESISIDTPEDLAQVIFKNS